MDHGDDRVCAGRSAANVGAVDPADVRAGVPGQPPRDRHHVQLEDRPAGQPAAHAGPQPDRPCARPRAGAGPVSRTRRLVPADARGPAGAVPVRGAERASACRTRAAASAARVRRRHRRCSTCTGTSTRASWSTPTRPTCTAIAATGRPTTPVSTVASARAAPGSARCRRRLPRARASTCSSRGPRAAAPTRSTSCLERRFKHPLITRSTIRAARALRPLQGRKGLYFSGQYTTGMDLQESARLLGHAGGRGARSRQPEAGVAEGAAERARTRRHLLRPLTRTACVAGSGSAGRARSGPVRADPGR